MSVGDSHMYGQSRFSGFGIPGLPGQRSNQQAFELATSAHYLQFHQLKAEMTSEVLELFRANEIGFIRPIKRKKCRPLDPVTALGVNMIDSFEIPNLEMIDEEKKETRAERRQKKSRLRSEEHLKENLEKIGAVSYTHLTLPTTPYV